MAKNWMKKIIDTMVGMELEDNLKLKVAMKLMDKSAATWWENLKLRTTVPITWSCLYVSSMINIILVSTKTRNHKSFSDLNS